MKCAVLLTPHANARYYISVRALSLAELTWMAPQIPAKVLGFESIGGLELLEIEIAEEHLARALAVLERHSSCQAVFEVVGDDVEPHRLLRPLPLPGGMKLEGDLSAVLKYKGKTNERFSALLVNLAVFSGEYAARFDQPLHVFDPMCGRGTGLFEALRRGYEAGGVEIDKADVQEAVQYVKRYLEIHKKKHSIKKSSMTYQGKAAGERTSVEGADGLRLTMVRGDTQIAHAFYPKDSFEALAVDLPYGIQHRSLSGKSAAQTDQLIRRSLPVWRDLLRPGAAMALAFNAHTVTLAKMREMLAEAGLQPLTGDAYDGLRHWVEQAVDRDIAVAIKS